MNRLFRWCMRRGAAILFAVAVLVLLLSLTAPLAELLGTTSRMAADHYYSPTGLSLNLQVLLQMLTLGFANAAIPFAAAVLIDRIDQWLATRTTEAVQ